MNTAQRYSSTNRSPLSRALSRLLPPPASVADPNPAQRLAELVTFTDSIRLSQRFGALQSIERDKTQQGREAACDAFLRVRGSMITAVVRSFDPDSRASRFKLPVIHAADSGPADTEMSSRLGGDSAAVAYQKFYVAHQRQMELSVQDLRHRVRKIASSTSAELARLSALDALLDEVARGHTRNGYGAIPGLLCEHFECLKRRFYATRTKAGPAGHGSPTYIEQFCDDMRALMLAEIDDRLLPVLGLVEAINQRSGR